MMYGDEATPILLGQASLNGKYIDLRWSFVYVGDDGYAINYSDSHILDRHLAGYLLAGLVYSAYIHQDPDEDKYSRRWELGYEEMTFRTTDEQRALAMVATFRRIRRVVERMESERGGYGLTHDDKLRAIGKAVGVEELWIPVSRANSYRDMSFMRYVLGAADVATKELERRAREWFPVKVSTW